jgi:hypothetical protein
VSLSASAQGACKPPKAHPVSDEDYGYNAAAIAVCQYDSSGAEFDGAAPPVYPPRIPNRTEGNLNAWWSDLSSSCPGIWPSVKAQWRQWPGNKSDFIFGVYTDLREHGCR